MTATDTDELLERAAALRPVLERNAAKGEEDRRIADESIDALVEAGLFKITVPRRFGGYEVDIRTKLEVSAAVAEGDGATGWVLALINVCHWLVGLYRDQAQQDIFGADPDARVCGVLDRDAAGAITEHALIPITDLAVEDTWFVAGMKGTGSNTLVA